MSKSYVCSRCMPLSSPPVEGSLFEHYKDRHPGETSLLLEKEGRKDDQEKLRMDLLSPSALEWLSQVLTYGSKKYGDRNWESGIAFSRVFGAVQRHLWAWWGGEEQDKESGLNHLAHAMCGLMFLIQYRAYVLDKFDDRPKRSL